MYLEALIDLIEKLCHSCNKDNLPDIKKYIKEISLCIKASITIEENIEINFIYKNNINIDVFFRIQK